MGLKLYNKTKAPDAALRKMLIAAGQRMGAKTDIVVKVTQGRRAGCSGLAIRASRVFRWHLKRGGWGWKGAVKTNGGYFLITLPCPRFCRAMGCDSLKRAQAVYELMLHEWRHIWQFRNGFERDRVKRTATGVRAKPHSKRREEIDAENAVHKALKKTPSKTAVEGIVGLGLWYEKGGREND